MNGSRRWGGPAALLLVALAGCGSVTTAGEATHRGDGTPLTLAALGEVRTLDPCGLADATAFAEHGDARPIRREWLDDCSYAVTIGDANARVDLGLVRTAEDMPDEDETRRVSTLGRGAGILRVTDGEDDAESPTCELQLVLSDGAGIEVRTGELDSGSDLGQVTLCAVARTGAEAVYRTLDAGEVTHWDPPADSLARVPACSLLAAADVAERIGVAPGETTRLPGEHQCLWGRPGGDSPNAQLDFVLGELSDYQVGGGATETIRGRKTLVLGSATESVNGCTLVTEHADFARAVRGERELAAVRVLSTDPKGKPCETGRALARRAWPKLPG